MGSRDLKIGGDNRGANLKAFVVILLRPIPAIHHLGESFNFDLCFFCCGERSKIGVLGTAFVDAEYLVDGVARICVFLASSTMLLLGPLFTNSSRDEMR